MKQPTTKQSSGLVTQTNTTFTHRAPSVPGNSATNSSNQVTKNDGGASIMLFRQQTTMRSQL